MSFFYFILATGCFHCTNTDESKKEEEMFRGYQLFVNEPGGLSDILSYIS